jgi:hypothetical protein
MAQELPTGAQPIDVDELLAAIGELYVQVRVYRRVLAQQQHQVDERANGALESLKPL